MASITAGRSSGTAGEVAELDAQATALKREIGNLAEAIAVTGGSVAVLAEKLAERQGRLAALDARLRLLKAAPGALTLQVKRLEVGVRKRLAALRDVMAEHPDKARAVMASLLDGPVTFTPLETAGGKRYELAGRIATGEVLRAIRPP